MTPPGALLMLGVTGPELTAAEAGLFRELQPVGFVLAARNLVSPEQTRRLTDSLRDLSQRQPVVAIARASSMTSPLAGIAPMAPSAAVLAAHDTMKATGTAGLLTGELLRMVGINFNFGPRLDPDPEPASAGLLESGWGRDPQRVIDHAGQWNRWLRKRGCVTCAGLFPGARASATLPELLREDLLPYTALMPELDAIQVGSGMFPNLDAERPASLSPRVIRRLLRDQLGFDHQLVLPAELGEISRHGGPAEAARLALEAGNDLVLLGSDTGPAREVAAALAALPHLVRSEAWERVERLRDKLHLADAMVRQKWTETCASLATLAGEVGRKVE